MKSLLFVSCFVSVLTSCSIWICEKPQIVNNASEPVLKGYFDSVNVRQFKTKIVFRTSEISGILICKKINDSTLAGSLINEFGIKGFDFTITPHGANLGYLFKKLDKWYIRKTLERDLHFLFSTPELHTICSINGKSEYVSAISKSLHYVYYLSNQQKLEQADMFKGARKSASLKMSSDELTGIKLNMTHLDGSLSYDFVELKN